MAQGGMGDVLTGVTAAFVAQGFPSLDAAILSCFVHGQTGSVLAKNQFVVTASQVAGEISTTIQKLL